MFGKPVDHYADRKCKSCMYTGQDRPCPCWVDAVEGMTETNIVTGEERLITGCFYQVIPQLMVHVVKASNRPAAEMSAMRAAIDRVADAHEQTKEITTVLLGKTLQAIPQEVAPPAPLKEITYARGSSGTQSD